MLIRIVRMTFKADKVEEFLSMFEEVKHRISMSEGCVHLELLPDYHQSNILSTYSIWESDEYLEKYRHSELFAEVWAKTKILFDGKPIAFSLKKDSAFDYNF